MHLNGNSIGNGAGCPIFLADSAPKVQTLFVNSKNSSRVIVTGWSSWFALENDSFENIKIYS